MIKVKCIKGYCDTKLNRSVAIGEEFSVTEDRAKQLIKAGVAVTPTTEEVAEPAPKKGRKKKEA